MSIIGKVGRRSPRIITLNVLIHVVLLIGAVTMLYPFLLMVSASIKSAVDSNRMTIMPEYLYKDRVLFQKYLEARYNEESARLADNYAGQYVAFQEVQEPERISPQLYADWQTFLQQHASEYGVYDYYVSEQYGRGVYPRNQRAIRNELRKENGGDLAVFNRRYGTGVQTWEEIVIEEKDIITRNYMTSSEGYLGRYQSFKRQIPLWHRNYINLDGSFIETELINTFGGDLSKLNSAWNTHYPSWQAITISETCPTDSLRSYWLHYVRQVLNIHHVQLDNTALPAFRRMLQAKYTDINTLNLTWHTHYTSFDAVTLPQNLPDSGALIEDVTYYVENLSQPDELRVRSINNGFRSWLSTKYADANALNQAWKTGYPNFASVTLTSDYPSNNLKEAEDWLGYINSSDLKSLKIKPSAREDWLTYLKTMYVLPDSTLDMDKVNSLLGTHYTREDDIYPAESQPSNPAYARLWQSFALSHTAPVNLSINLNPSVQSSYVSYLKKQYTGIDNLNLARGYTYASLMDMPFPQQQIDYSNYREHKANIKREFLVRNYAMVLDQMLHDARSLRNTFIYCLLSILVAISVNPLAAYALSRFKPRFAYQIIMLFMLTMAFPAMVMGIPNFLLLKKLNLLNTFAALILPAAADGYFIFLLKGFFDSLPRELYESARIDGAGEWRMFWQFTLYLSKPILAVIALSAFNAAYRNFLFAFIVCQDQSMWTLMVHIYELMQRASNSVGYAALVIAAIPTLAVFVFFQNIIIKGIVIPMEK